MACLGTDFSHSFVLLAFENTSSALTKGFDTSRLIKICPCCTSGYSHLRPSCLHLEHVGRERSHWLRRSDEGPIVANSLLHCYLDLHALTYSTATCPVWQSNHFLKPFLCYPPACFVTTARLWVRIDCVLPLFPLIRFIEMEVSCDSASLLNGTMM